MTIKRAPNILSAEDYREDPSNTQKHQKKETVFKGSFKNGFLEGEMNRKK